MQFIFVAKSKNRAMVRVLHNKDKIIADVLWDNKIVSAEDISEFEADFVKQVKRAGLSPISTQSILEPDEKKRQTMLTKLVNET